MNIDFDKYGHCVVCHKNMLIEEVVDHRVIKRFLPEYTEAEFLLDDKSRMRVAMCQSCKDNLTPHQYSDIMDTVKKGWVIETKDIPTWSEEKKKAHIDTYSQKQIIADSEGVPDDVIDKIHLEYQVNRVEKIDGTNLEA